MARVLIIGAVEAELGQAARIAQARGATLAQADGVSSGLARLRGEGADLVLCDLAHDVAWLAEQLARERIACPVIACGRDPDAEAVVRAIRAGAKDFLPLPPDADLIAAMLEAAAGERRETPVHRDPAMAAVLGRAEQLARSDAGILITGESGTGKEVLARHVHALSRRAKGPFVALNCAALPESLLESELFGHEKGAFSGALARRAGRIEQAHGGTLFLDELGDMPLELQAKLLRVLETKEVERLGGSVPVPVDVRILAATHQDLARAVKEGRFRQDLFFRLNVLPLHVPPLRERPEDLLPLARAFAAELAGPHVPLELAPGAEAALRAYAWPGNVRELRNLIERLNLLRGDGPLVLGPEAVAGPLAPAAPARPRLGDRSYREHVEDFERELIRAALQEGGSIAGAARLLQVDRGNLYRRIKALGLPVS